MADPEPSAPPSPWHAGELAMQRSIGAEDFMRDIGRRVVRDHLIDQHRDFYPQLPFVVLGAVDPAGDPWATLRAAPPGFLRSPDPLRLHVALGRDAADPAEPGFDNGRSIGLLGIELHTRRRNRLNGVVRRSDDSADGFDIEVRQSYGNCPKYIQLRDFRFVDGERASAPTWTDGLDARARTIIAESDTFFVASYVDLPDGTRQVDVSHRGGKPGFVRIDADGTLTVPDFTGNQFFNTLGNLLVNPRAGLVFVDFESGDLLQLTGAAEVLMDVPATEPFDGALRLWRVKPRRTVLRPGALPLRWAFRDGGFSPFALKTGAWRAS